MNRSIVWLILALVAVAVVSWWGLRSDAGAGRYRTASVERGPIEATVSAPGTLQPVEQVEVGSQVSGTVQRLFADYNSRVTAGQVLCQLESSSLRARLAQAEAAVARAEAAAHDSDLALERDRESDQSVTSDADSAAADAAQQHRDAELLSARAQLEVARVDLEHTIIRSPIDGVVLARTVQLGQTAAAGPQAPRLFVIARTLTRMQVEARIAEADVGRVRSGLPVTFTVDAYPDLRFRGQVQQVRLEPFAHQGTVSYVTIIATENPDLKLRPGMTASVSVRVAYREDALKVPNAALSFKPAAEAGARVGATAGAGAGALDSTTAVDSLSIMKPGMLYVLRGGRPVAITLLSGITDGVMIEIQAPDLEPDDAVIVGLELARGRR